MNARKIARGDLAAARAPSAPHGARLYESHYLTAVAPDGGRAVWIRYTTDKSAGDAARGRLWCTLFDRAAAAPLALRTPSPHLLTSTETWASIDGATIEPGLARGILADCEWDLRWRSSDPTLGYLPSAWLYDRRLPRSNGAALAPYATFDGWLDVAGERIDLDGWRGMVGHNWGSDHADRWIWMHVTGLGERDGDGWLDIVLARTRIGPLLTPWLPAGAVQLDGNRQRIDFGAARGLRVTVEPERLEVGLPRLGGGALMLRARMPGQDTVQWDYQTPDGDVRDVHNCSIASGRVELDGEPAIEIDGRLVIEVGG